MTSCDSYMLGYFHPSFKLHHYCGPLYKCLHSLSRRPLSLAVHDQKAFTQKIMPRYFETSTWKSYQRNINLWNFHTTRKGINKGYTTHACFRRGKVNLCSDMTRVRVKGTGKKRTVTSLQDEAYEAPPMTDGSHQVSQIPRSSNHTELTTSIALSNQRLSPNFASSGGQVELSASETSHPMMVAPFMDARTMLNRPWFGVASNPSGVASFANVASLDQFLAATNGIRARNHLLTTMLSQQQGLGRGFTGMASIAAPKVMNNQQQQGAMMAGLLRLAMNSHPPENPARYYK